MHDIVIKGAVVVDGTGAPPVRSDVAIDGERIAEVGSDLGGARRTIDGEGMHLTPGWVDIHTHYDGQVTWDPDLQPSSTNGVTSVVLGNCGVGFAPASADKHDWLVSLLEGVEDIPGTALAEGISWGWETFPEYLDVLDQMRWTVDVGTQLPHAALRTYVMGERGADPDARATTDEIMSMRQHCEESVRAGALGFTTTRTAAHKTSTGEQIGTLKAATDELLGITSALTNLGTGVVQLISDAYQSDDDDLVASELVLLEQLATSASVPLSFTVQQNDTTPDRFRELLGAIGRWRARGADVKGQVASRPIGVLIGLNASANPLMFSRTYRRDLRHLSSGQRLEMLGRSEVRAQLLHEHAAVTPDDFAGLIHSGYSRMYPLTEPIDYEPTPERSVAGMVATRGADPAELLYDLLLSENGSTLLYIPLMNYAHGSLDDVYEMMTSPNSVYGLSDAGAHCNAISDGSMPTTAITHWVRDRTRGPKLPIEQVVHGQTQRTASHVGWHDRGVVAPGYLADLNLIDLVGLRVAAPHLVRDLPAGGTRLLQDATGYRATFKRGVMTVCDGELTGSHPGKLQRGAKAL